MATNTSVFGMIAYFELPDEYVRYLQPNDAHRDNTENRRNTVLR